jgi:hypothetical protein
MDEANCRASSNDYTSGIMREAECISYNNAIEELRIKEYPMLQGKRSCKGS